MINNNFDVIFLQEASKLFLDNYSEKLETIYIIKKRDSDNCELLILLNRVTFRQFEINEINWWENEINWWEGDHRISIRINEASKNKLMMIHAEYEDIKFLFINVHLPTTRYNKEIIKTVIENRIKTDTDTDTNKSENQNLYIICAGDFNISKCEDIHFIENLIPLFDDEKSKDFTSFKLGVCINLKFEFFDIKSRHKFLDRIYVSENIKTTEMKNIIVPFYQYDINNEKYILKEPKKEESFSDFGYPYCDPDQKEIDCYINSYGNIIKKKQNILAF